MREVLNRLPKKRGRMKRVLSMVLVFAMILTLGQALPESAMTVQAADTDMNVTLHVYNDSTDGGLGYDKVYMQYWQYGTATITNATEEYFTSWSAYRYELTSEGNNWYTLTIAGSVEGL